MRMTRATAGSVAAAAGRACRGKVWGGLVDSAYRVGTLRFNLHKCDEVETCAGAGEGGRSATARLDAVGDGVLEHVQLLRGQQPRRVRPGQPTLESRELLRRDDLGRPPVRAMSALSGDC